MGMSADGNAKKDSAKAKEEIGAEESEEAELKRRRANFNFPRNDGHSLLYLGDVSKIEMETKLKQSNVAAELYYGGTLVAGRSGEVRVSHQNAQKTKLAIEATLTAEYFGIRDHIENQYHLM